MFSTLICHELGGWTSVHLLHMAFPKMLFFTKNGSTTRRRNQLHSVSSSHEKSTSTNLQDYREHTKSFQVTGGWLLLQCLRTVTKQLQLYSNTDLQSWETKRGSNSQKENTLQWASRSQQSLSETDSKHQVNSGQKSQVISTTCCTFQALPALPPLPLYQKSLISYHK